MKKTKTSIKSIVYHFIDGPTVSELSIFESTVPESTVPKLSIHSLPIKLKPGLISVQLKPIVHKEKIISSSSPSIDIKQEITMTNLGTLPHHEPIDTMILLRIRDINTLINLYLSYKHRFSKLLDNPYILRQISFNFGIEFKFINFRDFIKVFPSKFGVGCVVDEIDTATEPRLPDHLRWNSKYKDIWLNKLRIVEVMERQITNEAYYT